MKKKFKISNIFIIILAIMIIGNVYISIHKTFFKEDIAKIFGFSSIVDLSDVMSPTVKHGDVVLLNEEETYQEDDLIVVYYNDEFEIHRIVEETQNGYITKYDNVESVNREIVPYDDVQGKVFYTFKNGEVICTSTFAVIILFAILVHIHKFKNKHGVKVSIHDRIEYANEKKESVLEVKSNNKKENKEKIGKGKTEEKEKIKKEPNIVIIVIRKIKETLLKIQGRRLVEVLSILLIFGSIGTFTNARYSSEYSFDSTGHIANFYVEGVYTNYQEIIIDSLYPTQNKSFTVDVLNYNLDTVSDVKQEYEIMLFTTNNMPVEYIIEEVDPVAEQVYLGDFTKTVDTYLATGGILNHTTPEKHTYRITVSWLPGEDDPKYSKEIDYIKLILNAKQKD